MTRVVNIRDRKPDINVGSRRVHALTEIARAADEQPPLEAMSNIERGLLLLDLCDELTIALRNGQQLDLALIDIAGGALAWLETIERDRAA